MVSVPDPIDALSQALARRHFRGFGPGNGTRTMNLGLATTMEPVIDGMPTDWLSVEDVSILSRHFEDTLLGFGVKTIRTAQTLARALALIEQAPPDLPPLGVALIRDKRFAVAKRLQP